MFLYLNTSWLSVCKQIAMVRKSYRVLATVCEMINTGGGGPETSFEDKDRDFQVNKM